MSLISLAVTLIVIGVLLWLVNTYIPMDGKIKQILNVVVVICVVVWLLFAFGVLVIPATFKCAAGPVTGLKGLAATQPAVVRPVIRLCDFRDRLITLCIASKPQASDGPGWVAWFWPSRWEPACWPVPRPNR